jgi:hypothetical protein
MKKILNFLKIFLKIFSRILQEYFPKNNQKVGGCGLCYPVCTPLKTFSKPNKFQLTIDFKVVVIVFILDPSSLM